MNAGVVPKPIFGRGGAGSQLRKTLNGQIMKKSKGDGLYPCDYPQLGEPIFHLEEREGQRNVYFESKSLLQKLQMYGSENREEKTKRE